MPIYEYQCINPKCGYILQQYENFNTCSALTCPKCGRLMTKIMSAPGLLVVK